MFLLEHGASANGPVTLSEDQIPPLAVAALTLNLDSFFFDELLSRGADAPVTSAAGATVLEYLLLHEGAGPQIRAVLKRFPTLLDPDRYPSELILHLAITIGHSTVVSALLDGGADVSIEDDEGYIAISRAASKLNIECFETVLAYEVRQMPANEKRNCRLGRALQIACSSGNLVAISLLLEAGTDSNFRFHMDVYIFAPYFWVWNRRLFYEKSFDRRFELQKSYEIFKFHQALSL